MMILNATGRYSAGLLRGKPRGLLWRLRFPGQWPPESHRLPAQLTEALGGQIALRPYLKVNSPYRRKRQRPQDRVADIGHNLSVFKLWLATKLFPLRIVAEFMPQSVACREVIVGEHVLQIRLLRARNRFAEE